MLPDEPTDEDRLEQLPQDGDTPFRPAPPSRDDALAADNDDQPTDGDVNDTHPATDTNIDLQELYDEGVDGAAEIAEPNAGNDVVGYEKPEQIPPS